MLARPLRMVLVSLVVLGFVPLVSGCSTMSPVPLDVNLIPTDVQRLVEKRFPSELCRNTKIEYFVFEEEDDGCFILAMVRYDYALHDMRVEELCFGYAKKEMDSEGNLIWTGQMHHGSGYVRIAGRNAKAKIISNKFCAQPGPEYTAGWVTNSKVAKIEVTHRFGHTVTARIKNGFWWAGPYDWDRWSELKATAYDKAGKVLYLMDDTQGP